MFNVSDISRDQCQLYGKQASLGYDWWWHSFTAYEEGSDTPRPFFIEFFLCNPALGGEEPIFGQSKENQEKGIRPSYLMVNVGTWGKDARQLHRFFGWKKIQVDYGCPFSIKAEDCYLDETKTHGHVHVEKQDADAHPEWMSQDGDIAWDLSIDKRIAFNVGYGASKPSRKAQLFEMFWHAEGMKTYFEGWVEYNGKRYNVRKQDCYGYADKNWGKDFTSPWLWLSSNHLISKTSGKKLENSVFDIGGGRPKVGRLALQGQLLSAFYYEGKCYEFNFSKFWHRVKTKFECKETATQILWHVEQKTWNYSMVSDFTCEKEDMLLIQYEAPSGTKRHNRLWNGGNGKGVVKLYHHKKLIDEIEAYNVGCEYGEYDH